MQILSDAAFHMDGSGDIVNTIASKLYYMPEEMCQCSEEAFTAVPNCNTFSRFKVLVHETLDACTSLDEVDCDAWMEFSEKCEPNVVKEVREGEPRESKARLRREFHLRRCTDTSALVVSVT